MTNILDTVFECFCASEQGFSLSNHLNTIGQLFCSLSSRKLYLTLKHKIRWDKMLERTTWVAFSLPINVPLLHMDATSWCHPIYACLVQAVAVHRTPIRGSLGTHSVYFSGKSWPPLQPSE